ncbi:MAG: hypothetical protein II058_03865, partial [Rhodocyclaceae bacterium]|nr:hypothetical protein [Rhodocyclaceae bacterium]
RDKADDFSPSHKQHQHPAKARTQPWRSGVAQARSQSANNVPVSAISHLGWYATDVQTAI